MYLSSRPRGTDLTDGGLRRLRWRYGLDREIGPGVILVDPRHGMITTVLGRVVDN